MLLFLAAFATPPSPASANLYEVEVCTPNSPAGDGIENAEVGAPPLLYNPCGNPELGGIRQVTVGGTVPAGAGQTWVLRAPGDTTIRTLKFTRALTHQSMSFLQWRLLTAGGVVLDTFLDDGRVLPRFEERALGVNTSAILSHQFCPFPTSSCTGGEFRATIFDLKVTLDDSVPPVFSNLIIPSGSLRGIVHASYSARDSGSGVARVDLIVDGVKQSSIADGNDGKCHRQQPYQFVQPCRSSITSPLPLDTTALEDGRHELQLKAVDAVGLEVSSATFTITVRNAPANSRRPFIAGSATVGAQLIADKGSWQGDPTTFAYQWLRCPPPARAEGDTAGCAPIAGATSQQYVLGAADLGHRDLVRLTAANAKGSEAAVSAPSEIVAQPIRKGPVLSHVSLSRKRFRVARSPSDKRGGTVLALSSNKPGNLLIAIERARGKKFKPIAKLAAKIKAGRSQVLLNGIIGKKRLSPGRYRLKVTVTDAKGSVSEPVTLPFAILPRR